MARLSRGLADVRICLDSSRSIRLVVRWALPHRAKYLVAEWWTTFCIELLLCGDRKCAVRVRHSDVCPTVFPTELRRDLRPASAVRFPDGKNAYKLLRDAYMIVPSLTVKRD